MPITIYNPYRNPAKAVTTQTNMGMFDNFSTAERTKAALNKNSADLGSNLEKATSLAAGLEMIAKDTNNPDSARAQKLVDTLRSDKSTPSQKLHALSEASGIKSVVGAASQVYAGMSGDIRAKENTNFGLGATTKGDMDSNADNTNVIKLSGNEKGEGGVYNELNSNKEIGQQVLSDSAKALKITDSQLNQKDENGDLTFQALANRKAVANNAVETLKAAPEAYNAMLKDGSLTELKKHISLDENIKGSGSAEAIRVKTTNDVTKVLGVEGSSLSKAAQEVMTAAKTPVQMVKIIEDYGKKFPGLKNQLTQISDSLKNTTFFKNDQPFNLGQVTDNIKK